MKIAKYVVACQVALSAVLLVVFVTRSAATDKPPVAAAATATAGAPAAVGHGEVVPAAAPAKAGDGHGDHGEGHAAEGKTAAKKPAAPEVYGEGDVEEEGFKIEGHPPKAAEKGKKPGKADAKAANLAGDPKAVAQALLAGNARFMDGRRSTVNLVEQREGSAGGQHPGVMVLGCADSRVPPELIFDRGVGEMFVVRSAGNIAEPVAVGSLEYAFEHLHAKVLLVLGHEKCGAVQAALSEAKMPSPNLDAMVANILPAVKELKSWAEGDALIHMAVEANVRRQADEALRKSTILRNAVAKKELTLLKAVYDLQTGHVSPL